MKKTILLIAVLVLGINGLEAQNKFGITAGMDLASVTNKLSSNKTTISETGFYAGVFGDFAISDVSGVRAELTYGAIGGDVDLGIIHLPILYRYQVADKFNLLAGPQVNYVIDDLGEGGTQFGIGLGAGLSYDITDDIGIIAKYSFQLNDTMSGTADTSDVDSSILDLVGDLDFSSKMNFLQVGLAYSF